MMITLTPTRWVNLDRISYFVRDLRAGTLRARDRGGRKDLMTLTGLDALCAAAALDAFIDRMAGRVRLLRLTSSHWLNMQSVADVKLDSGSGWLFVYDSAGPTTLLALQGAAAIEASESIRMYLAQFESRTRDPSS